MPGVPGSRDVQDDFMAAPFSCCLQSVRRRLLLLDRLFQTWHAGGIRGDDRAAARRLKRALAEEHDLVEEMQQVCTGSNPRCEEVVDRYVDNNSKQVIPALVALRA